MKELSNLKEVPFTAEDMRNLYQISEAMINAEDDVAKCDAIADVFSDAMAYNAANHTEPSQNDIMLNIALVMFNYSRRAIKAISEANKKLGIERIYDTPLPKPLSDKSIYVNAIEILLLSELAETPGNRCVYTKTKLFRLLGMINENYLKKREYVTSDELKEFAQV